MLSLKKGNTIAMIKGGKNNNDIVHVDFENNEYNSIKLKDPKSSFLPFFDKKSAFERLIWYIFAPSGSGKSTLIRDFLLEYLKRTKIDIFLFSNKTEDDKLDAVPNIQRIDLKKIDKNYKNKNKESKEDKENEESGRISMEDLRNSICVFDDIDSIPQKNLKDTVYGLMIEILNIGRSYNISCIMGNHANSERMLTKNIISESQFITYFPDFGLKIENEYLVNKKIRISLNTMKFIQKQRSRWCTIYKFAPMCIILQKMVFTVSSMEYEEEEEEEEEEDDKTLEGKGILDVFKSAGKNLKTVYTPDLKHYLQKSYNTITKYGNEKVKSMIITRTPVPTAVTGALNVVSLGSFNKALRNHNLDPDKLFHLALVCTLESGQQITCEKNEVVDITPTVKITSSTETMPVDMIGANFTLSDMLDKARKNVGDELYFSYQSLTNNCQYYIKYLLTAENLYTDKINKFLFQDFTAVKNEIPDYVNKISNFTTGLAATARKFGFGKKNQFKRTIV